VKAARSSLAVLAIVLGLSGLAVRLDASPDEDEPKKTETPATPGTPGASGFGPNAIAPLLSKTVFPAVVKVYGAGGFTGMPAYGTGVIVDPSGIVATFWSITLKTDMLKVVLDDGRHFPAAIARVDVNRGIALLRIYADRNAPPTPLSAPVPFLAPGDSDALRPGDEVYAIGNAFDDAAGDEKCGVMSGIVSAISKLDTRVGIEDGPSLGKMIVIDASNNPGTQGGPLVTREGKLVGVLGRVLESRSTNTTVNFAVPSSAIKPVLEDLLAGKEAPQEKPQPSRGGAIETGIRLLDAHISRPPPAYVERVLPGSAAAKAGVKPDDLIFRLDGVVVRTCRTFEDLLRSRQPGEKVKLLVKRGKDVVELELELAPRKEG